ncbi:hypothetical protein [Flexistipes sinusarabici]|uniref:hypothetical protein n=1 Tax=Flexistipes sinusarabici TaxID=2352 RepID=UPI002353ED68|nr:hypothetical protein [Flexistipes sinusarabici]
MKKIYLIFIVFLMIFALFLPEFKQNMNQRSGLEKLGYTPQGELYKSVLGEFRWFMGDYLTFKSIIYYGGKINELRQRKYKEVEFYNLFRTIETSIILNPYHEDSYYFAQAAFVWDIGRVKEVNALLKYVMKYRTWDYRIPFFLGFNYSYFMKDYEKAAKYFRKAAKISGSLLFTKLAARYFYEGGETELGIVFLKFMYENARKEAVKESYKLRLEALKKIKMLEDGVSEYKNRFNSLPENLDQLVEKGILDKIPQDPYGGEFYINENGKIRTTSKLTNKKGGKNEGS